MSRARFALRRKTLRRGARNAGMGDGAFELLLSAPHRRATRASAAAARTEDGVQRRDIDRKAPRGPGGLAVLWRGPSQSVGAAALSGGAHVEGTRAAADARSAVARAVAHAAEGRESAHGNHHHRAAQQSLGQRPHCDGHGRGGTGDGVRGRRSLHDGMRGPSRGQESHAVRGLGAAPAGGARLLRRIPRGGRGRHSQPARPRQPVHERRLPSGDRLPGHAIFAFVRAPTGMQWLRRAVHPHAERAIPVGAHVSERGRVAAWAGGISRALQSALDRPALGLPHASPGSPAASCTWSHCMNTLSSVSKKSGALHLNGNGRISRSLANYFFVRYGLGLAHFEALPRPAGDYGAAIGRCLTGATAAPDQYFVLLLATPKAISIPPPGKKGVGGIYKVEKRLMSRGWVERRVG